MSMTPTFVDRMVGARGVKPMTSEHTASVADANSPGSSADRARSSARRALLGAFYSPWTERARWALDHHGIAYRFEEHVPVVGELALRRRRSATKGAPA